MPSFKMTVCDYKTMASFVKSRTALCYLTTFLPVYIFLGHADLLMNTVNPLLHSSLQVATRSFLFGSMRLKSFYKKHNKPQNTKKPQNLQALS